ncbi:MAG: N-formylglutamate amidohydrolase, partial [Candidatus Competibacter sp.]
MNDSAPRLSLFPGLLGPEDPPPFTVVNPDGQSPLVLVCDHASNAVPAALSQLGLGPMELAQH